MSEFDLPRNLIAAVNRYNDPRQRAWLAELPLIVEKLSARWSLDVGRPFQPGGVASWVAPARDATGRRMVLKVGWRHDEAKHEAAGLRTWDGRGTVRLLNSVSWDNTCGLLLEACEPGTTLFRALPPSEQDRVIAALLRRLWITPPAGHPFRPLRDMCAAWADEFELRCTTQPQIDPGLARTGIAVFRSMPDTAERSVVLYTDLHPGNVLAAEREPWLGIDPKPYVGDPTYDPLQHMLNFPDRLTADADGFTRRMADLLDLDADRLRLWLFARCMQDSLDRPYMGDVARGLAP